MNSDQPNPSDNYVNTELENDLLEAATDLRDALRDKAKLNTVFTMRRVELQLKPQQMVAEDVKELRKHFQASQAVFSMLIGISPSTLQSWEQGIQDPPAWANRLFDVMGSNPDPWFELLEKATSRSEELC